ncbi:MAG: FAD binding domain-containing protein [Elusimicrobia bacterium]|nr:FAD binding domain-containing protein [Elusimicrobiota bacterium]
MIYPQYIQPVSLTEIFRKIPQDKKIYFLAGGTDLFNYLRDGLVDAENSCFVDITLLKYAETNGIVEETENIKIGALTTFSTLSESKLLKQYCPDLVAAAKVLGTPQIANRATIGGNIANASPAGDALPPLAAHFAKAEITNSKGSRLINISDIFAGPKKTTLANGEIITAVIIPKIKAKSGFTVVGTFKKIGNRKSHIIAKASVAVFAVVKNKSVDYISVALGAVGPKIIEAKNISKILTGKEISPELTEKCKDEIRKIVSPIDDFRSTAEYRLEIAPILFQQAINEIINE